MATWNSTAPDGAQSVKSNESILQDNTTYIETTMAIDHFWDAGGTKDGHHQFVQTEATNIDDTSLETNATLATGMDGVYYSRFKTSTESTAQQDCQPYFINETGGGPTTNILQLLGIRACVVFNVTASAISSTPYKHNVSSVSRNATGDYTISFSTSLPSINYLAFSGGLRDNATNRELFSCVRGDTTIGASKKVGSCRIITSTASGSLVDPLQVWFVCFGG